MEEKNVLCFLLWNLFTKFIMAFMTYWLEDFIYEPKFRSLMSTTILHVNTLLIQYGTDVVRC